MGVSDAVISVEREEDVEDENVENESDEDGD